MYDEFATNVVIFSIGIFIFLYVLEPILIRLSIKNKRVSVYKLGADLYIAFLLVYSIYFLKMMLHSSFLIPALIFLLILNIYTIYSIKEEMFRIHIIIIFNYYMKKIHNK